MDSLDLLVIDDEPMMQRIFAHLLRDQSFKFQCMTQANEALQALKEQKPALVLLDYHMPEMNGREMIIKISEAHMFGHTRFFLYTSDRLDEDEVMRMRTLGFEGVIPKPIQKQKLVELIKESIAEQAA